MPRSLSHKKYSFPSTDFCMGNDQEVNPIGTLQDFAYFQRYEKDSMMLQSLDYYSKNACTGESPLDILPHLKSKTDETLDLIVPILDAAHNDKQDIFDSQCGADTAILINSLSNIKTSLLGISNQLNESIEATSCNSIRPLLRDLVFGAPCTDTVDGFTWMFSSLMTMTILGLIMITTRAAMYNPIIASPKGRRREKEFKQYKDFMKEKGYDTSEWRMDPKSSTPKMNLFGINTFETEESGSKSGASPTSITSSEAGAAEWEDEESTSYISKSALVPILQEDGPRAEHADKSLNPISDEDESDHCSVYSFDSDDSSINPPPSLLSSVKSNFSTIVSTLRITPRNSEGAVYEDIPSPANREVPTLTLPVPVRQRQYHEKIASHFGKDDRSVGDSSISSSHRGSHVDSVKCEGDDQSFRDEDISYFSDTASQMSASSRQSSASFASSHNSSRSGKMQLPSKPQPGAPQKSMSSLARTIVNV